MANDPVAQVLSHRDYYGAYHHHKEQMAFASVALYLGAAATVAFQEKPFWTEVKPTWPLYVALAVSTALGFFFVAWQFRMRADAERVVEMCSAILADHLSPERGPTETNLHRLSSLLREPKRSWLDNPGVSKALAYAAMGTWSLVVLIRIACR